MKSVNKNEITKVITNFFLILVKDIFQPSSAKYSIQWNNSH